MPPISTAEIGKCFEQRGTPAEEKFLKCSGTSQTLGLLPVLLRVVVPMGRLIPRQNDVGGRAQRVSPPLLVC